MSKHSEDKTSEEETTVPADTDTDQAEETVTDEAVDKTDEADAPDESTETADETSESAEPDKSKRRIQWARVFAFGVIPAVALLLAAGAGYLKWMDNSVRDSDRARALPPAARPPCPRPRALLSGRESSDGDCPSP